jgi:hypothetical protein
LRKYDRRTLHTLECFVVGTFDCIAEDEARNEIKQQWPERAQHRVRVLRAEKEVRQVAQEGISFGFSRWLRCITLYLQQRARGQWKHIRVA